MVKDSSIYDTTLIKLIILFVMEKMEIPLNENSLIDICYSRNGWINYMDCKENLASLIDVGFIYKTNDNDNEERYTITYEGRSCLSHFYYKIPEALREQITEFSKENRMHFKRSQEYVSDYYKNKDGSYICILKIKDVSVGDPIFEIKIKAPSRQSAIEACKKWRDTAHIAYENIYEMYIVND